MIARQVEYIYSRVSTTKQDSMMQVIELKQMYPDADVWQETGSAYRGKLKKLDELLDVMKRGDKLIIYSIDRLGRRVGALCNLFEKLIERGIILISRREGIDLSTATGKMIAHIFSAIAQVESEIRSDRVRSGMKQKQKEWTDAGNKGSKFGHKKGYTPSHSKIKGTKSHTRKELIEGFPQQVIDMHLAGMSIRKITDIMGHRTETRVSISTVHKYIVQYREEGLIPTPTVTPYDESIYTPNPKKPRIGDCKRKRKKEKKT
ncbi:unnamed protein product [marine sediment metagenome]|uniref:Resolvase/invertase-type recombinase catalytic domain-containing protein n=1 Tax=marine sediment metagenome TaxID=412755 RepID=X0Z2Y4_9ZZZZ